MAVNYPPVFRYISGGQLNTMRREMDRFLVHTYTRIPRAPPYVTAPPTPNSEDDWGLPVTGFPVLPPDQQATMENLPCFYAEKEMAVVTPSGLTTLNIPILYIRFNDQLIEGDRVTDVMAADGTLLIPQPVLVEQVSPQDPNMGGPVFIEARLRRVETILSS
jgi:hypothetical protein